MCQEGQQNRHANALLFCFVLIYPVGGLTGKSGPRQ